MTLLPLLLDLQASIPSTIDSSLARVKLKRIIKELEQEQEPSKAIPWPGAKILEYTKPNLDKINIQIGGGGCGVGGMSGIREDNLEGRN